MSVNTIPNTSNNTTMQLADDLYNLLINNKQVTGWGKSIYPDDKENIKTKGLIIIKKGNEYSDVMLGGHKKRNLINKIKQEYQGSFGDTGATTKNKSKRDSPNKKYNSEEYEWIILSTDDIKITSSGLYKLRSEMKSKLGIK